MPARTKTSTTQEAPPAYAVRVAGEVVYVDTSVWVALLAREAPHAALAQWLAAAPQVLCCADWTQVELASAVGIKYRRGELALADAQRIGAVFASMMAYQVREIPLQSSDVRQAMALCHDMDKGLRAGDALHLAVAMRYQCSHFFSFDHSLNRNAELAGLRLTRL